MTPTPTTPGTPEREALVAAMDAARSFAAAHVAALAAEIRNWQDTGLLIDGKLRELATMVPNASHDALSAAEHLATRAALDALAAPPAAGGVQALPMPGSPEASAMIDSMLAERGWPASAKNAAQAGYEAARRMLAATQPAAPAPIDMVLHCPKCHRQHIDAPEVNDRRLAAIDPPAAWAVAPWRNELHRSHWCHGCGHIWRPADVPTNGVAAIKTKGKADSALASPAAPAPASDEREALDWIDDFIARCNGDDRGACEPVNVLRRALAARAPQAAAEGQERHMPLPYSTPLELWRAFKGGAKFVLHYHGRAFDVEHMEAHAKVCYVQPPGLPVKVFPDGRSAEGDKGTIWLSQAAAPQPTVQAEAVQTLRERIREEFQLVAGLGRSACINSAMLNVDALISALSAPPVGEPAQRRVRKTGGSFEHTGTVVAEFHTLAGQPRIVLEFDAPVAGMLHVYRPDQVESLDSAPSPSASAGEKR